jgi:L-fuconolactonase
MRIDAHHRLWTLARGDYGWLTPALTPIYRDFQFSDLAPHLAAAGIAGTILVQAAPTEAETMFLLDVAESVEAVRGVVGWADFDAADGAARIDALAARSLLVGLRPMVQDTADADWLLGPALAPLLIAMARNHLIFDALVLPRHLPRLSRVVSRHSDLTFVLDHCAKPRLATGEIAAWQRDIALLAQHPNIVCKLSGLVTEAAPDWRVGDLRQAADHVVTCFGPQRLLWGSDWPVVDLAGGYATWFAAAESLLADLSLNEKAAVFGGNAARIYLSHRGRRPRSDDKCLYFPAPVVRPLTI